MIKYKMYFSSKGNKRMEPEEWVIVTLHETKSYFFQLELFIGCLKGYQHDITIVLCLTCFFLQIYHFKFEKLCFI